MRQGGGIELASRADDPLSDVVASLNLTGVRPVDIAAGASWRLRFERQAPLWFGLVASGSCWLALDGGAEGPLALGPRDCFLIAGGRPFWLSSERDGRGTRGHLDCAVFDDTPTRLGSGSGTRVLGASFAFAEPTADLVGRLLPSVIHVRGRSDAAPMLRWSIERLHQELAHRRPGASVVVDRLSQILFAYVVRSHDLYGEGPELGWIGACADARIGAAMRLIHRDLARRWTLAEMAGAAGMSRSTFALRFKAAVGVAPLDYLLRWRMHVAGRELQRTAKSVGSVAIALGYESESAFSNAFKRVMGRAPSVYRAELQA